MRASTIARLPLEALGLCVCLSWLAPTSQQGWAADAPPARLGCESRTVADGAKYVLRNGNPLAVL